MKYLVLPFLLAFFFITPAYANAAIAIDATSVGNAPSATSITFSHTTSGSNRILFVGVITTSGRTVTVTYNGVSMTQIGVAEDTVFGHLSALFYLVAPAIGANNVVASVSGGAIWIGGTAASYTGAKQTGVPDAYTTRITTETTSNVTLTSIAEDSWLVMSTRSNTGDSNAGTGTLERANVAGYGQLYDSDGARTAGSNSLQTTQSSGSVAHVLASFAPAVAASTPASILSLVRSWWIF